MELQSYESIILLGMLFTTIFMIYKTYQTPVNSKSFVINIYLYVIVALLFIALIGKYTELSKITDVENMWKMIILYFVLGCTGISMMISDRMFITHIGFLLLLLALSLVIGTSYKYSSNVTQAATITAIIVIILTTIVFMSSEENLIRMKDWLPNLTSILLCIICIELGYMLLFDGNQEFYKILSVSVIGLFMFFILSDTSRLLLESKNIGCKTHSCINYPLKSSSLVLDYVNIFVRLLNNKK